MDTTKNISRRESPSIKCACSKVRLSILGLAFRTNFIKRSYTQSVQIRRHNRLSKLYTKGGDYVPRLREPPETRIKKELEANLERYYKLNEISKEQKDAVFGSQSTRYRKEHDLGKMTVNELIILAKMFNVSVSELFEPAKV